jgi:RNA polymerase sigma factor (sigma-70 family)
MDWLSRRGRLPAARLTNGENGSPDALLEEIIAAGEEAEPQHYMEAVQRRKSLSQAIEGLSGSDRLILYLRFDQELSGVEIADLLDISHGAARQRLFRAVRRLEERLREVCPELMSSEEQ